MSRAQGDKPPQGTAQAVVGFVLFFPVLILLYAVIAGANYLFFGSLN